MTKVNIREALNQMDKDTNCKYDLVTLYEGYSFNDEEKKEIAKMISDNEDAEVIYDRLSDKFGKDVDFDDDDISDIITEDFDDNDLHYLELLDDEPLYDDELSNIYGGDRNICPECGSSNYHDGHCYACDTNYIPNELEEDKYNSELVDDLVKKAFTKEQAEYIVSHDSGMAEYLAYGDADNDDFEYFIKYINKRLNEDTIKTSKGKWVNKGEEGTHGTFDTKKEADAQRKAMFASGWKGESLEEELKTYYISYKEVEGKFKDKYVDLPIRANSKEEAEEKFVKDHPNVKSYDYKITSMNPLKESENEDLISVSDIRKILSHYPEVGAYDEHTIGDNIKYYTLIKSKKDARKYKYHSDYWGTAGEYREDNNQLVSKLEPYIGKQVIVSDDNTVFILVGVLIDDQYNSLDHTKLLIKEGYNSTSTTDKHANEKLEENKFNDESLKEDWRDDKFTEDDFNKYVAKMKSEAYRLSNSIQYMINKHPEYADLFDNLVSEIVDIFSRTYLNEASYGGAYDVADDEYFTKDDGMEAANEVAYQLEKEFPEAELEVMDMQLDNHSFYVTITDKDGNEFSEEITLDLRKIRHPLDLIKKYAPALTERFIKQIKDYYSEM